MVEQLFKAKEGHYSRMGQLIRKSAFQKLLARINVDEAHFIHTAGIKQHSVDPFRPAWGTVDELRALLASSIPWHLFSATWPPHIRKTVKSKILRLNYVSIEISSNQPNTIYTTHEVVALSICSLTNAAGKCWEKRFIAVGILSCPPEGLQ